MILTIFLIILAQLSWGNVISIDDLLLRNDLYYKKFTDIPFTGQVFGKEKGRLKDGVKEGYWEEYDEDGLLTAKGKFKNGKKDGIWEGYEKGKYDSGNKVGIWEYYSKDGQLESKGKYDSGNKVGIWEYYSKDGYLYQKGNFKDGKKDGLWKSYYEDGQLRSKEKYDIGNKVGIWEKFYENGKLWKREEYKKGEPVGAHVEFLDDGKSLVYRVLWDEDGSGLILSEENYDWSGNGNGDWEEFFKDNSFVVRARGKFKNYKKHGAAYEYFRSTNLYGYGSYKDGKKDGIWEYMSEKTDLLKVNCGTVKLEPLKNVLKDSQALRGISNQLRGV